MKTSELIAALTSALEQHGDVEVGVYENEGDLSWSLVSDVTFSNVEDWKEPQYWPNAVPRMALTILP